MASRKELDPQIIAKWLRRPKSKRTSIDVLSFYGDLKKNHPKPLTFRSKGDKYQTLRVILKNHIIT